MSLIPEYQESFIMQITSNTAPIECMEEVYFYKFTDPYVGQWNNEPIMTRYRAYRETPKGYWIVPDYDWHPLTVNIDRKKWIRKQYPNDRTRKKMFAYQSKEDAIYSYYRRKLEHIRHLEIKHIQLKGIIRKIESEYTFWGVSRPQRYSLMRNLTSLKKKRITKEFIDEIEMIL